MNLSPTFSRPQRSLLAGLFVTAVAALAIGWTAGTVAASSSSRTAASTATTPGAGAGALGAPGVGTTTVLPVNAGGATTSGTASSITYPVPGYNSLGVAPQGTILAEGTGTATLKADGSDKAAALEKATQAALADAHTQALAAAGAMGVGLGDIYSVSIASNSSYAYATPDCVVAPPVPGNGATGSAVGAPASATVICPQLGTSTPTSEQLVVTLIVAYKYS